MIKSLIFGVLVCAVALGASTGVQMAMGMVMAGAKAGATEGKGEEAGVALDEHGKPQEPKKTRILNIPIMKDEKIAGYIIAQFGYRLGKAEYQKMPPEPFLVDEAFKALYADSKLDFRHLETYDLSVLTRGLKERANARIGAPAIAEVLVQDFTFVDREDVH